MKRNAIIIIVTVLILAAIGFCTWWFCFRTGETTDSSDKVVFQMKDSGEYIKRLQIALNEKGYNLDVDGIWGRATDKAVYEYFGKGTVTLAEIRTLEGK